MTRICVGRISGVFGVRGWVKIRSHTSPVANILDYQPWQLDTREGWVETSIEAGQGHGKGIIAKLPGCADREQASRYVGTDIAVSRAQLPEIDEDEYYWTDWIGLQVNTMQGICLGHIANLIETGSNDVMVVKNEREHLIPLIWDSVVMQVDIQQGCIVVDWDPDF